METREAIEALLGGPLSQRLMTQSLVPAKPQGYLPNTGPLASETPMTDMLMPDRNMTMLDRFKWAGTPQGGFELAANLLGPGRRVPVPGLRGPGEAPYFKTWHASPHNIEKFDINKVGTGTGATAQGHGLYSAEAKPTAKSYWDDFGLGQKVFAGGERVRSIPSGSNLQTPQEAVALKLADIAQTRREATGKNIEADQVVRVLERQLGRSPNDDFNQTLFRTLQDMKAKGIEMPQPAWMYEVGVKAPRSSFLDWDNPIGRHPMAERINRLVSPNQPATPETKGSAIYQTLQNIGYKAPDVSKMLYEEAGVPGVRYLDMMSRRAGWSPQFQATHDYASKLLNRAGGDFDAAIQAVKGKPYPPVMDLLMEGRAAGHLPKPFTPTSNYVAFNDNVYDILSKYGLLGAGSVPAVVQALQQRQSTLPEQTGN